MPEKFAHLLLTLCSHTYDELQSLFGTTSGVRQGCFLFDFVMDKVMEDALGPHDVDVELASDSCADNLECLLESTGHALAGFPRVSAPFGVFCIFPRYKVLLHDWTSVAPSSIFDGEDLTTVDRSTCLGNRVTKDDSTIVKVNTRTFKARMTR